LHSNPTAGKNYLEASDAGRYTSKLWHDKDYPRFQILTI